MKKQPAKKQPPKKQSAKKQSAKKTTAKIKVEKKNPKKDYSYIDVIRKDKKGRTADVRCMYSGGDSSPYVLEMICNEVRTLKLGDTLTIIPVEILTTK
jgi:hypothetical protein